MAKARNNPIIRHNNKTDAFKRPAHYDFMTSAEIAKAKFTGLRNNQMAVCTEIWVLGEMRASVPFEASLSALEEKYKEIFGFHMDTKMAGVKK